MTKREIIRYLVLRSIGNFLLLFAVFGVVATFGPTLYYEAVFRISSARGITYTVEESQTTGPTGFGEILAKDRERQQSSGFARLLTGPQEQILRPSDTQFNILIPKLGINSKVFPNIDSSSESEFLPVLSQGVAHASGTVFPGMAGNIYLFAHSTDNWWNVGRYNAIFYLIKDLQAGDEIVIFFDNQRHNYKVTGSSVVEASDVSYITEAQTGKEVLILQTCWPPATTWKRLLVFAVPK